MIEYLDGKNIAIVGNAKSIFTKNHNIDSHEVIIRINRGFPIRGLDSFNGSRTDIIAISMNLSDEEIKQYNPEYILYCSPKNREQLNPYIKENAVFYDRIDWEVLSRSLEARPSTGCMVFDFITNYVDFKELHLYGYDFMRSETWYTDAQHHGEHNYVAEEEYLDLWEMNDNRITIHRDY